MRVSQAFEEAFFWNYDDADFCWRIKQIKYKVAVIGNSYIIHYDGAILGKENLVKAYLSLRNQIAAYLQKPAFLTSTAGFDIAADRNIQSGCLETAKRRVMYLWFQHLKQLKILENCIEGYVGFPIGA